MTLKRFSDLQQSNLLVKVIYSLIFGTAWFLVLYGPHALDPSYVDWIYVLGSDTFQHQIGWEWFRQAQWHFPLGFIGDYGYPFGTYISYTDSIPLMALPLKLLSPLLGETFQYLGIWAWLSVTAQYFTGILLLREFTDSFFKKVVGASLLVLIPALTYRVFFHDSLSAQWLLIAGIWLLIREYRGKTSWTAWPVLFALAILIHLYFVAILAPFYLVCLYYRTRRVGFRLATFRDSIAVAVILVIIGFSIGLFSLNVGNLLAEGYGYFSWNFNGFFNPDKYSFFLPALPTGTEGQIEGFSYLGLGLLFLLPIAMYLFFRFDRSRNTYRFYAPIILISIVLVLFAASNKAFFNTTNLWDFQLPKKVEILVALFRASGRFIWPVLYLIVGFAIISVIRNSRFALPILSLALLLQYLDTQPIFDTKQIQKGQVYASPLASEFWQTAADVNKHVFLIPAAKAHAVYEPFALLSRQRELTLNWGYFSRADLGAIRNLGEQSWVDLVNDQADAETIYVFWDGEWADEASRQFSATMILCEVDGYTVALSRDNPVVSLGNIPFKECKYP